MNFREENILQKALDKFQKTTAIEIEFHTDVYDEPIPPDVLIRINHQGLEWYFAGHVKLVRSNNHYESLTIHKGLFKPLKRLLLLRQGFINHCYV